MKTHHFLKAIDKPVRRKRLVWLFSLFMCLFTISAFAQEYQVTGRVTDTENNPLPGLNIVVKGTTTGTTTDIEGNYVINLTTKDVVLVFSALGYTTQELTVSESQKLDVILAEDITGLEEIIVIGYGTQKKSLVTGAISSLENEDISSSVQRVEQALQGKAAGVSVIPSSGAPGAEMKVRIRGVGTNENSNPLYIVDGMKSGDINYLNPNDIESMEVLKDAASSAIYGSQGANGVVIITTKSGKPGKSTVNYSFQYGIQSIPDGPKMMSSAQYAEFQNESEGSTFFDLNNLPSTTNWWDEVAVKAPMTKHDLSFSGGNEKSTYLISTSLNNQDGIIGGGDYSNFERITTRFNGTHKVKNWLKVGNNIAFTYTKSSGITEDETHNGVVQSMLMFDPTTPVKYTGTLPTHVQNLVDADEDLITDKNGAYYGISEFLDAGEIYNPFIRLEALNKIGKTKEKKVLGSVFATLTPIKGLSITSRIGIDIAYQSFHDYSTPFYANSDNGNPGGTVTKNELNWNTWLWENYATYSKSFADHNITIMAGMSAQEYVHENLVTTAGPMVRIHPNFAYPDYVASEDADDVDGTIEKHQMASYYGRLSYDFKNKYMLETTIRRDGSSLFADNNIWGLFPSFSAGWVVTHEDFWSIDPISYLKFRASWGQNGSTSALTPNQYRRTISSSGITYVDGLDNSIPGAEPNRHPNPDLKWEVSEQTNIGIDLNALNNKLYFNFDWYKKITKDLLTPGQYSFELGNHSPTVNAGDIENKGVELVIGYREKKGDFKYDVSFNVSKVKNEVTFLNGSIDRVAGASLPSLGTLTYFEVGQPVWYFRGYENAGVFRDQAHIDQWKAENNITDLNYNPLPGDAIVVNHVDDGMVTSSDMVNIGSPHHDLYYGANINFEYKTIDLNVFIQGASGGQNFIGFVRNDRGKVNRLESMFNGRWTPTNTDASLPRAGYRDAKYYQSNLLIQDASYLKIRQIQIGYTLPSSLLEAAKLSKVRIYVSLNDFFTFTKYEGPDPEVGSKENNRQGLDYGYYPNAKKMLFGINVTF